MDFYFTLSSGPISDLQNNEAALSEYKLEKAIKLEEEYEVALVQSVFEDVFTGSLATFNIFPLSSSMEMHSFKLSADDGEDVEKIIKNLNSKLSDFYSNQEKPIIEYNNHLNEFYLELPKGWQHYVTDLDESFLEHSNGIFKFKNKKYFFQRHFFVFSNLIDNQVTGNSMHPLLTNFCLNEINSNFVSYTPLTPKYVKLKDKVIETFDLKYSTKLNEVSQLSGKIISTFHFRKINGF